ncbi:hypothetical protein D9M72_434440 [compost metagenome]
MPSPTIATTAPPSPSACTRAALSSGNTSACTSSRPSSRATRAAAPALSPVSITVRTPAPRSRAMASAAPGLIASPNATSPATRGGVVSTSHDTVRPSSRSRCATGASEPASAPSASRRRSLPSCSAWPSTTPAMPRPGSAWTFPALGTARPPACAAASTARASGCSLPACSAASLVSSALPPASAGSAACSATTSGLPTVSVPVLSNATTLTRCATSSASASLIRMPARAPAPVPAMIAVGVANPSAHGQAITSTATALSNAASQFPPSRPQPSTVSSAMTSTTGTNTALTWSTMRWIGALAACACSTMRMMRASTVSAPTATVRATSSPSKLIAPPVSRSPGFLGTGTLSPVSIDSSAWLLPSITSASTGMRSPGRTTTSSPTRTDASGTLASWPPRRTRAVSGRSAASARMASAVWRLARVSSHLPSRTSVITTAALSKYRCGMASAGVRHISHSDKPYAAVVPSATSRSMLPAPARTAFQPAL